MTDERHRNRHREHPGNADGGMDPDRLRYFTQPHGERPTTRHRRRRADGGTDGSPVRPPAATPPPDPTPPDPTPRDQRIARAEPAPPAAPVTRVAPAADGPPQSMRSRGVRAPAPVETTGPVETTAPVETMPAVRAEFDPATSPAGAATGAVDTGAFDMGTFGTGAFDTGTFDTSTAHMSAVENPAIDLGAVETVEPHRHTRSVTETPVVEPEWSEAAWRADADRRSAIAPGALVAAADPTLPADLPDLGVPGYETTGFDTPGGDLPDFDTPDAEDRALATLDDDIVDHPERTPAAERRRRRRRIGMIIAASVLAVIVVAVGVIGATMAGLFDSRKDYTNAAGTSDVLVHIPDSSSIKQIGTILADDDVVGSTRAFVDAADGAALPGGYYKLRTEIPAKTAVEMISDPDSSHRVGRIVVPAGLQLDSKKLPDGTTTSGIFQMISNQTAVQINGDRIGVSVEQLQQAAADGSVADLGIPQWAQAAFNALAGDHRRIEGLIAPGTWESIDPHQSATEILKYLITESAHRYEQWGLLTNNQSSLTPYQTMVAASLVQAEVNQPADYAKVARVILNRLAKNQELQFDSTANYTAAVTDIDVHSDDLKADTPWNTYVHKGLPPTPIGAVDEKALEAMEHPADGDWLYFVTVDAKGTTLFTADFDQHRRNISKACANKFITCR
ncbi:endolytic transglycosylase MltG [Gordonia sp. NPDC003376]